MTKISSVPIGSIVRMEDGTMGVVQSQIRCVIWLEELVTRRLRPDEYVYVVEDGLDIAKRRLAELRAEHP